MKQVVVLGVVVALLGGGYLIAVKFELFENASMSASSIEADTVMLQQDVLADIKELSAIQIDASLFQMSEYAALEEYPLQDVTFEVSRQNPFAPF